MHFIYMIPFDILQKALPSLPDEILLLFAISTTGSICVFVDLYFWLLSLPSPRPFRRAGRDAERKLLLDASLAK